LLSHLGFYFEILVDHYEKCYLSILQSANLVENTEATTKSKPEALPVSKTSNGNNKQHANKSGPQKTVKMTNSDNNNNVKSQSSIDRFIRTPQGRLAAANVRTPFSIR
jgi:chromosomal replication initiation ATPase DnaA